MARLIHLRLTKRAEELVQALEQDGLTEQDIFSKSLYLLELVRRSGRVAMLRIGVKPNDAAVEYIFSVGTTLAIRLRPPDGEHTFEAEKERSVEAEKE